MTRPSGSDGRPQERDLAREASEVLNYNQQLVQFAECHARRRIQAKADTLILINSLFVASMGVGSVSASGPLVEMARGLTVLVLCLVVVMSARRRRLRPGRTFSSSATSSNARIPPTMPRSSCARRSRSRWTTCCIGPAWWPGSPSASSRPMPESAAYRGIRPSRR
jgi:hypothetical protein